MEINFKNFKVNSVKYSSGVFSGENTQMKWRHIKKSNDGFGTLQGNKNKSYNNQHAVMKHVHEKKQAMQKGEDNKDNHPQ